MITLRKTEQIEIYQVELALNEKTKQSPFIAVLILAEELHKEGFYIDSEKLREKLLPTLPLRACSNLLERLFFQGYFDKIVKLIGKKYTVDIGNKFSVDLAYLKSLSDEVLSGDIMITDYYRLTELGENSAIDKSFWVGEKGIYNVYVSNSNLLDQKIIKIEKVDRSEDDRNGNRISKTPNFILQYHNQILNINKKDIRIEEIEDKCFQLKPLECSLEIETKEDEGFIRLKEKQIFFQSSFETNEAELKKELLTNTNELDYDENKKVVLSEFDQDNLSFYRKVKLRNPYFKKNKFNSVEIENVAFIPSDIQNAELCLIEILFKDIDKYFFDENSFNEFVSNKAKPILPHYKLKLPKRNKLKQIFAEKENSFYQTAKLETIDYLNY